MLPHSPPGLPFHPTTRPTTRSHHPDPHSTLSPGPHPKLRQRGAPQRQSPRIERRANTLSCWTTRRHGLHSLLMHTMGAMYLQMPLCHLLFSITPQTFSITPQTFSKPHPTLPPHVHALSIALVFCLSISPCFGSCPDTWFWPCYPRSTCLCLCWASFQPVKPGRKF